MCIRLKQSSSFMTQTSLVEALGSSLTSECQQLPMLCLGTSNAWPTLRTVHWCSGHPKLAAQRQHGSGVFRLCPEPCNNTSTNYPALHGRSLPTTASQ